MRQTADWPQHKESCPGHLRKVARTNIEKGEGFWKERNFVQNFRCAEMALTKLKQLKDRSLAVIMSVEFEMQCTEFREPKTGGFRMCHGEIQHVGNNEHVKSRYGRCCIPVD